jgi:hypothetical protein
VSAVDLFGVPTMLPEGKGKQDRDRAERGALLDRVKARIDALRVSRGMTEDDLASAARLGYW